MMQSIAQVALVVRDYDEAIDFYTRSLNFTLVEDTYQPEQDKRWVVVAPPGSGGTSLLLARASTSEQEPFVGNQTGGRVFLFLNTDDFWRDYRNLIARGVTFVREPRSESYGTVAVFKDLYGNLWDLLQRKSGNAPAGRTTSGGDGSGRRLKTAIPVLHVTGSAAAEAFYCDKLGFRCEFAYRPTQASDPCYMGVVRDDARLHLSSFADDGVSGSLVYLVAEDIDALHGELTGNGVPVEMPPTDQSWGNREMHVRDADRNKIAFVRPGTK
jgi:catechol 2,3-dioxygenase-like lactoylglutathione lyase family enzyme